MQNIQPSSTIWVKKMDRRVYFEVMVIWNTLQHVDSLLLNCSYTAVGLFVLGRTFQEAWGSHASKKQSEFNDYLEVVSVQMNSTVIHIEQSTSSVIFYLCTLTHACESTLGFNATSFYDYVDSDGSAYVFKQNNSFIG